MEDSVQWLYQSGVGLNCFDPPYALFRQAKDRDEVNRIIESESGGAEQLRDASLNELLSHDTRRVERALFYLMLIGQAGDIPAVEALSGHPNDTVKKGAKTCRFELKKRRVT
jgi:hypothetical protein